MRFSQSIIWTILILLGIQSLSGADDTGITDGSFNVSVSGSSSYSVPLKCSPGTSGMQPALSLTYDSQAPTASIGIGWSIQGFSVITRGAKTLERDGLVAGINFDRSDALFLDGARLIPVGFSGASLDQATEVEFRTELENYSKVLAFNYGPSGPESFKVWTKAGIIMEFGSTVPSQIKRQDGKIFVWACAKVADTAGNYMLFDYQQNGAGDYNLREVRYTGNTRTSPELLPYAAITFEYKSEPRPTRSYFGGHPIVKDSRLVAIRSTFGPTIMREYNLDYDDVPSMGRFRLKQLQEFAGDGRSFAPTRFTYNDPNPGWDPIPKFSLPVAMNGSPLGKRGVFLVDLDHDGRLDMLISRSVGGHAEQKALINTQTGWREEPALAPPVVFATDSQISAESIENGIWLGDMDGDKRPDLLVWNKISGQQSEPQAWLNRASGWIPAPSNYKSILPLPATPTLPPLSIDGVKNEGVFFGDLDGDGLEDCFWSYTEPGSTQKQEGWLRMVAATNSPASQPSPTPDGGWAEPGITSPKFTPPQLIAPNLKASGVWLADLDNDGHVDLFHHRIVNGASEKLAFLWDASGWTFNKSAFHLHDAPPQNPKDIQFARLEDSAREFVLYWDDSTSSMKTFAAAATGWQNFSASLASPLRFTTPNGDDAFVRFVDVAGDKRDDLVCHTQGSPVIQRVYVNKGTTSWSPMDPSLVPPLLLSYGANKEAPHFLADLDGDGKTDILYLSDNQTPSSTYLNRLPVRWQISRDFAPPQAVAIAEKYDVGMRFVDFDGDGLTDIIGRYRKKDGTDDPVFTAAWKNNANDLTGAGQGWLSVPSFVPPSPTGWEDEGGDWGSRFIDLNGDGLIDQIFAREGEARKTWINQGVGAGAQGDAFKEDTANLFTLPTDVTKKEYGGLGVLLIDVNGDGLTDILESRSTTQNTSAAVNTFVRKAWLNQGPGAAGSIWQPTTEWLLPIQLSQDMIYMPPENEGVNGWEIPNTEDYPAKAQKLGGRDCTVIITDLNGDRLPDIAYNFQWKGTTIVPHQPANWPQGSIKITRNTKEEKDAYINNGHGWVKSSGYIPKYRLDEKDGERRFAELLDVSGDGLPDLIYVGKKATGENLSETYLNTGTGWTQNPVPEWQIPAPALEAGDGDSGYRMLDVTGDGLVDILVHKVDEAGGRRKFAFINNGTTWIQDDAFAPPDEFAFAKHGQTDLGVRTVDVNGDGLPDLVRSRNKADGTLDARAALLNKSKRSDTLSSITNGFGVRWSIGYQSLSEPIGIQDFFSNNAIKPVYEAPPTSGTYPILRAAPPAYIVTSISVTEGGQKEQRFRYRYGNFRVNTREARPLGFEWRETWNETQLPTTQPHGMRERSTFHQNEYALTGRSKNIEILVPHKAASGVLSQVRHQFTENAWTTTQRDALPRPDGRPYQIFNAVLDTTRSDSHDLDGTLLGSQTDVFEFDDWGNATKTTTSRSDQTKAVTVSTFTNDPAKWFLGRLTQSTVTLTGDGGATISRNAEFAYDPNTGVLVEEVAYAGHPKAVTTRYKYDLFGNKTTSTVSANNVQARTSKVEFDPKGRFAIKGTNAIGHSSTTEFDPVLGVPIKITDANGVSATTEYDSHGRRTRSISPTGIATTMSYNWLPNGTPNGALIEVTTQTGALPASIGWLDHKGRPLKAITVGAGGRKVVAETEYDILGRTTRTSDPHFETDPPVFTEYKDYDILNRPTAVRTPDGALSKYRYIGYKTIVTDKLGRVSESETNLRKLPIRIKDPAGSILRYEYDAADRLVRVLNPDGTRVENSYDSVGHRTQARDPDLGTWSYTYNALGELLSQKDAKGQVTSITYDRLSRPLTRTEADRSTTWQYDSAPHGIGSLAVVKDSEGYVEENQYDRLGRPVATTFTMRGEKFTTSSQLDDYSRIVRLNYPTGFAVENVYDQWGFFTEVKDAKTNLPFWKAEKFNEKGQVLTETFGNGVTSAASFSRTTRFLDSIETKGRDGTAIQKLDYTYDLAGNILKRKDHAEQRFEQFRYDDLDRLRQVMQNQQVVATMAYGVSGNILKKSDTGMFDYAHNAAPAHGVKSIQRPDGLVSQYKYDRNGNMTSGPKGFFEYTAANLVKFVHCGDSSAAFVYSPSGAKYWEEYRDGHLRQETLSVGLYERVNEEMAPPFAPGRDWMRGWQYNMAEESKPGFFERKLATNERLRHRHYIAGPVGVIAVHEQLTEFFPVQRNLRARIPVSGMPLERSSRDSCVTAYMHRDALGSIKVLTDSGGNIIERLNYDSWGERQELADSKPSKRTHHSLRNGYTQHEHLDNLGLVHMQSRVYDPDIGRFVSPDTLVDGTTTAQGYNRFAYVHNNPLRYSDPSGHGFFDFVGDIVGGIGDFIGGVANAAWEGIKFVGELHWNAIKAAGKWIGENWKTIVIVAAAVVVGVATAGTLGPVIAGALAGALSGGLQAGLYGGSFSDIMQGAFMGGVTGAIGGVASLGAGAITSSAMSSTAQAFGRAGVYAAAGGVKASITGGNFWRGALAGAVSSGIISAGVQEIKGFDGAGVVRITTAATAGGCVSVLNGGKFENGAMSGAFEQLYVHESRGADWQSGALKYAKYGLKAIGFARALPATVAGMVAGGVLVSAGGKFEGVTENGIAVRSPWDVGNGAMTVGNVIMFSNGTKIDGEVGYYDGTASGRFNTHEDVHTYQWGALGWKGFLQRYHEQGYWTPGGQGFNSLEQDADHHQ